MTGVVVENRLPGARSPNSGTARPRWAPT